MTTDRAKRYAANRAIEDSKRDGCLFCRSRQFLTVDHLDGYESHGEPANLAWLCKSCNTRKGAVFARLGIGERTHQFNPEQLGFGFPPRAEYDQARAADRKRKAAEHQAKLREKREQRKRERAAEKRERAEEQKRIKAEISGLGAALQRAKRAGDTDAARAIRDDINVLMGYVRNPAGAIRTPGQWSRDVATVLDSRASRSAVAASISRIRATSPAMRRKLAAQKNPPPTYGQYAYAVGMYDHGKGVQSFGEVIHRTPKRLRRVYAEQIAEKKRRRGTVRTRSDADQVPF